MPVDWKPRAGVKVVVSFTTLPHHLDKLRETIGSLVAQSLNPDAIYINVPEGKNKRTGEQYEVPKYLMVMDIDKVTVNRCEEYGPLTKLFPTLLHERDPDTIIITVDDDKIYPAELIRTLAWHIEKDRNSHVSYGLCGWSFMPVPTERSVVPVFMCLGSCEAPMAGKWMCCRQCAVMPTDANILMQTTKY
jgi:hypothetical protein